MAPPELLRTPLASLHEALGAKTAPFGGWLMPIQYQGIIAEHLHTRAAAGLFDLSHMGRLAVSGPDAEALLQRATTNDVSKLAMGAAHYTLMCNDRGRVLEDLLVYRFDGYWRLVVNASNRARVLDHLEQLRSFSGCQAEVRDDTFSLALLGLQGPASEAVLQAFIRGDLANLTYYHARNDQFVDGAITPSPSTGEGRGGGEFVISRTGYTGEDGFELMVDASRAVQLWSALMADDRVRPVGLGARDTLRLEAGMALYGHELTEEVTPFEAGLGRVVRLEKGPFVGREALSAHAAAGPRRKLVGLRLGAGAVPRADCPVTRDDREVGRVVSGTFSPTLRCPIATAYVRPDLTPEGTDLAVTIRGTPAAARVVALPFVPHRTKFRVSGSAFRVGKPELQTRNSELETRNPK